LRPGTQGRGATGDGHRHAAVDVLRHWDQLRGFRSGGRCPRSEQRDRPGRRSGCRLFSGPGLALRFLELAVLLDELGYQRVDDVLGFSWGCAGPAVRRSVPRPVPPDGSWLASFRTRPCMSSTVVMSNRWPQHGISCQ
jgi:hypothetical protein